MDNTKRREESKEQESEELYSCRKPARSQKSNYLKGFWCAVAVVEEENRFDDVEDDVRY